MSDLPDPRSTPDMGASFGVYSRALPKAGMTPGDIVAGVATVIWLLLVGGFFVFSDSGNTESGPLTKIMGLVAILMPIALIWLAAIMSRTARDMRAEAQRLQSSVDAMRQAYVNQAQAGLRRAAGEKPAGAGDDAAVHEQSPFVAFTSRRDAEAVQASADQKAALATPKPTDTAEDQATLALGTPAEELARPVSVSDFIRAMNFPDNAEDKEGFRALRRALDDRSLSKLIRAAQDALTLLSQDGIYMDDLTPDRARPEIWRRFAEGERGRTIAGLGGVRDRSSLALTAGRMRQDAIFRDAAHHFLRQFDQTFSSFEKNASDIEIAELAETRTARAFMLLGRVTGIFD
ncbi:MAG: hypothetical protein WBC95_14870 [Albidovulum sp.]